jgi:hypothetical protein
MPAGTEGPAHLFFAGAEPSQIAAPAVSPINPRRISIEFFHLLWRYSSNVQFPARRA